jgi:hypothetical protein
MEYVMTKGVKVRQGSLLYQLWRFMLLSMRFAKLTRVGCGSAAHGHA